MIGLTGRTATTATVGALLCGAVAGCTIDAFTYTTGRYGTTTVRQIHLACEDTYEVYDRPDAGTFLVVTNGLNESLAGICTGTAALPRPERMRRAARLFLEETTDRPACRITRESELTPLHTEFAYRCPAPALVRPAAAAPGPGRPPRP